MSIPHLLIWVIGFAGLGIAAVYSSLALLASAVGQVRKPRAVSRRAMAQLPATKQLPATAQLATTAHPPVTVLKPLCGAEPGLYEHLRSFCVQDYPTYQVIFGVRDAADPAAAVAQRLMAEFPHLPIDLVVNPQQHGNNHKTNNLINMLERARYDLLVMADSDAFVEPEYLAIVVAPLLDPTVGLVTCTYRGVPTRGIWSRLGAMYINEWYQPMVLLAWLFGYDRYVSGQTLCVRQDTLRAIGGLRAIADYLADDHQLGERVHGLGLRIVLSPYVVRGEHHEPNLASLSDHEVRWMRTLHILQPWSFRMIFLTFSLPLGLVCLPLALAGQTLSRTAWALFGATAAVRVAQHVLSGLEREGHPLADLWLVPMRDGLLCWIWLRSFFTSRITWRGNEFDVDADGCMRRL